jgi:hypothetical protein
VRNGDFYPSQHRHRRLVESLRRYFNPQIYTKTTLNGISILQLFSLLLSTVYMFLAAEKLSIILNYLLHFATNSPFTMMLMMMMMMQKEVKEQTEFLKT